MAVMRTQVAIVGGGASGLMLGHLLHLAGIDSIIIEASTKEHVIERVRAGVLEQGTVDLLCASGVGERLMREGMRHEGIFIAFDGARHRIDMARLTGGRGITIYGQNEVVKDLLAARTASGRPLLFEAADVTISGVDTHAPVIHFTHEGLRHEIRCEYIAGCDGFHGVCRPSIPEGALRTFDRRYPFAWLGILASAPPVSDELVYTLHPRGFALFSMRSPQVTRLYLQCAEEDRAANWSDDQVWAELRTRLTMADGWAPVEGPITQKAVTGMRSFVVEPMHYGRLCLAGDAAHIVPPTGAKGLNLAMADVWRLSQAIEAMVRGDAPARVLSDYSARGLRRTWRAQRFSWWMTTMLHRDERDTAFDERRRVADLDYLVGSTAAMTSLAENYVGMPLD